MSYSDAYDPLEGVAIIGMEGRFSGAPTIDAFWKLLQDGKESITFFSEQELEPADRDEIDNRRDPGYVRARGVLEGIEMFDADFFGMSPREAAITDPQHRLFLEAAWTALENAGYNPKANIGSIGVYAGMSNNTYFLNNVYGHRKVIKTVGSSQVMMGNEKDYLATRVSYKLDLRGPSLNIYTACSTSLVAVCQAFTGLSNFQCDMALAGGVSISLPQKRGYLYHDGAITSPDGHCRPFDINAHGTVFSNGLGIVVLKRLSDALEDGDTVYAVIKGAAINNDGSSRVSFTAPSVDGQAEVISMAQAIAGIDPITVSYVEAHGTGTKLGDPVEIAGLTKAFREGTDKKGFCAIGSVKSNIGHLDVAAGVAGLIKTVLAMKNRQLPASLHFTAPNPDIDLENSPFFVNTELTSWRSDGTPIRAGVSSLGAGGTNAHVVLEEAPDQPQHERGRSHHLVLLSAKSEQVLEAMSSRLACHLECHSDLDLADVGYTLQVGRQSMPHRRMLVASDINEATHLLKSHATRETARCVSAPPPSVVFVFPGQGAQYVNMGRNFYEDDPFFKSLIDRCADILAPKLGRNLRDVLYPETGAIEKSQQLLQQTRFTQPSLFIVEYALASLLEKWGIFPEMMLGHSVGEFVAATLSGVFRLEDALHLVATRAQMMESLPSGAMLSVRMSVEDLKSRLPQGLDIAAVNAPRLCVVSGPHDEINEFSYKLKQEDIPSKILHTSHAFHSAMMDGIVEPFAAEVRKIGPARPERPYMSTVTARPITDAEATDPMYWSRHMRRTVLFADTLREVCKGGNRLLLEVGPRNTSTQMAKQTASDPKSILAVATLEASAENGKEWRSLLRAVGVLWLYGISPDWSKVIGKGKPRRVALPTYPFERKRYWLDPVLQAEHSKPEAMSMTSQPWCNEEDRGNGWKFGMRANEYLSKDMNMNSEPVHKKIISSRNNHMIEQIQKTIEDVTGIEIPTSDVETSFLELGLDSLALTQCSLILKRELGVDVTFRQLIESEMSLKSLAEIAAPQLRDRFNSESHNESNESTIADTVHETNTENETMIVSHPLEMPPAHGPINGASVENIVYHQLQLMSKQLDTIGINAARMQHNILGFSVETSQQPNHLAQLFGRSLPSNGNRKSSTESTIVASSETTTAKKTFGAMTRIDRTKSKLSTEQQRNLDSFISNYNSKTSKSKHYTETHRDCLADPRVVTGFKPKFKEITYPIVISQSKGSRLWDIDGNEYIDMINGFGAILFGHSPPFVKEAIELQLQKGIEIGPQNPLAGEVAQLICEITKSERAVFCNTGSEAVMGAMRISRCVTGRDKIVMFTDSYHGMFDEVIVRGSKKLRSLPAAPGIPYESVKNMILLEYGNHQSLEIISRNADDIAAVLVEPIQSRNLELQPKDFLLELRRITQKNEIALIFDEIVTGFRTHLGGAQAIFGVSADIVTYGKVVGGGIPIGIITGKAKYMNALDGGFWQYGDSSIPEVGVTYFAGTFVRHPLALAAAQAVLKHLKTNGPGLQEQLNSRTLACVKRLRAFIQSVGVPMKVQHFSSAFQLHYTTDVPYGGLIYPILRYKGVHIFEGRTWFLTTSHTSKDIDAVVTAIEESVDEMIAGGFLPSSRMGKGSLEKAEELNQMIIESKPPVPGAKLGKCPDGNPAWFIPDPDRKGKFLKVG